MCRFKYNIAGFVLIFIINLLINLGQVNAQHSGVYDSVISTDCSFLVFNGQSHVSQAMFGVHHAKLSSVQAEEMGIESGRFITHRPTPQPLRAGSGRFSWLPSTGILVECLFDRYQPALPLRYANWQQRLEALGQAYAEAVRGNETQHVIEFWNEPYLNWAAKPGVNYDGVHYNHEQAGLDATVVSPFTGEPVDEMQWKRSVRIVDPQTGEPNYLAWRYSPKDIADGQTFMFRGKEYVGRAGWIVEDTRRQFWWAGPHDYEMYSAMLSVFGRAYKESNPKASLIAGWDFHIFQDNWAAWDMLHRPLIDDHIDLIDGYTEHHYGGDTRRVTASYELVWAYALTKHGKKLAFYNTEAGGMLDPERPGNPKPAAHGPRRAIGAMTYTLRDITYMLAMSPDKAKARAAHQPLDNGGDVYAYRLLRPLRGQLVHVQSSDPEIYTVGTLDNAQLTLVAFNDSIIPKQVLLDFAFPAEVSLRTGQISSVIIDQLGHLHIEREAVVRNSELTTTTLHIEPKSAVVFTAELDNAPVDVPVVYREQVPSPAILQSLKDPFVAELCLPRVASGKKILRAVLQVCLSRQPKAAVNVYVNGRHLEYLHHGPITRLHLPLDYIQDDNQVVVRSDDEGLMLNTLSLLVDFNE